MFRRIRLADRLSLPKAVLSAVVGLTLVGCGERDVVADRIAELGGYPPATLASEAAGRLSAVESGRFPDRRGTGAADHGRGPESQRPDPTSVTTIAADIAAKALRFNPDRAPDELQREIVAALETDDRISAEKKAEFAEALALAFVSAQP
ncbi:MAG: hypothetical protein AAF907_00765 [Planctomycetota bacterium]